MKSMGSETGCPSSKVHRCYAGAQRPNNARSSTHRNHCHAKYETSLISIKQNSKERINHGVALATGSELLYSNNIWVADTGASCHTTNSGHVSVLTKNTGATIKNLKPSLDASGNKMRTQKLIDVTGSILDSRTQKTITITMKNCRFGGSKFNLCSLIKMTDSG